MKRVLIGLGILAVLLAIASPWAYFLKKEAENEMAASHNLAVARFAQSHAGATMTGFMNPEELYFATWETDTRVGMSLYVDGIWVVIGVQEKPRTETETPKP